MKIVMLSALLCAFGLSTALAFDNVNIHPENCNLVESITKDKVFEGKPFFDTGCAVFVPTETFFKKYKYCALAGIVTENKKPIEYCQFGYTDRSKSKLFFTQAQGVLCYYTCLTP